MIHECVEKLIENIPTTMKNEKSIKLDVVLDGGLFNGSYLVGALYFLKEMEKKQYVNIERISCVSIGAVVAFLYIIDELDLFVKLYGIVANDLKKNYNLKIIKKLKTLLGEKILRENISHDICNKVQNKLYISYYDVNKCKKIVKNKFKSIDDIFNTIIKSCFIPYLIDGNILYKNKYADGITPYFFNEVKNKKILYLNLCGYDKFFDIFSIKNEKSNHHRILTGLLDIHNFYIKQTTTHMCSYVKEWSIINKTSHYIKCIFEKIIIYIFYIILNIKKYIPEKIKFGIIYKIISRIISRISLDIYIILLETYCI